MNVAELKKMLDKYPDDMEVLTSMYSDYVLVAEESFSVVKAVNKDFYVMRSHSTMNEGNKTNEKEYLYLEGN